MINVTRFDSDRRRIEGLRIHFDMKRHPAFLPTAIAMIHDFSAFRKPTGLAYLEAPEIGRFPPIRNQFGALRAPRPLDFRPEVVSQFQILGHVLTNAHVVPRLREYPRGRGKGSQTRCNRRRKRSCPPAYRRRKRSCLLRMSPGPVTPRQRHLRKSLCVLEVKLPHSVFRCGHFGSPAQYDTGIVSSLAGLAGDTRYRTSLLVTTPTIRPSYLQQGLRISGLYGR